MKFIEFIKKYWKIILAALGTIAAGVAAAIIAQINIERNKIIDTSKEDVAVSKSKDEDRTKETKTITEIKTETKEVVKEAEKVIIKSSEVIKETETIKETNKPIEIKIEEKVKENKEVIEENKEFISDARKEIEEMKREAGL